ncbi:MAG: molybdenum cofactor guanylyltransferase [Bacteroidota bacterium]
MNSISGIILAGGESKRMGIEKSLVNYNEKKLIEYPIELLKKCCNEIIISSETDKLSEYNFRKVADEKGKFGPLSGIYSCLKASKTERNIIISCDMPLVSSELINYLIQIQSDAELVMPFYNSLYEPLCAIYNKSLIPIIEDLFEQNDFSPLRLIPISNFRKAEINESQSFFNKQLFKNINSLEDLTK